MNSDKYRTFEISENDSLKRLDNIIRRFLPQMPLKRIFKCIRSGDIRINGKKVKQNHRLKIGDKLNIYIPLLNFKKNETQTDSNTRLDITRIVYEDKNILIYNKKRGIIVHGEKNSLDKQVQNYLSNKVKDSLSFNSGPLHRLDRNTDGLIVFSVSLNGARTFTKLLQNGDIKKVYITVVEGEHFKKEVWKDYISRDEKEFKSNLDNSGKLAHTVFNPIFRKNGKTVALVEIKTGRTHQIRVQCSIHSRPLVGDRKYNNKTSYRGYFLAAISLTFNKNSDILERRSFSIPVTGIKHPLLTEVFNKDDLKKIDGLINKEIKL